jgi:hypothetical protein
MILWVRKKGRKEGKARKGPHIAMINREERRNEGAAYCDITGFATVVAKVTQEFVTRLYCECIITKNYNCDVISHYAAPLFLLPPMIINKQPTPYISSKMIQELPLRFRSDAHLINFFSLCSSSSNSWKRFNKQFRSNHFSPLFEMGCMVEGLQKLRGCLRVSRERQQGCTFKSKLPVHSST